MGRWTELEAHVGEGSFLSKDPLLLMERHNADCDAYEARIAELERLLLGSAEETRINFNGLIDSQTELAATNAAYAQLLIDYEQVLSDLVESDATLDRLREVVDKWKAFDRFTAYDVMDAIQPILYPKETEHG